MAHKEGRCAHGVGETVLLWTATPDVGTIHTGRRQARQNAPMEAEQLEPWTPLGELTGLMEAPSLDDLYRRLILWPPARRNAWGSFEPWCLFHRFHEHDQEGAATTAMLLVTDSRWGKVARQLMSQIEESGLIPAEHLDLLAGSFLAAGTHLYWDTPDEWWEGPEIVITLGGDDGPEIIEEPPVEERTGPTVAPREVRTPLRRWAAARLVQADPARWAGLVARAKELDPRSAAGVMRGLLDAIDALPSEVPKILLDLTTEWPDKGVRQAAAELIAGHERAGDPAVPAEAVRGQTGKRQTARQLQPSLF